MPRLRGLASLLCVLLPGCLFAQRQAWLPITAQDLAVGEVPGNPGASAIQLYYSQYIDDGDENNEGEYVYRRIKILNEKGNKYADVEIRLPTDFTLADLKARTVHPDGKVIDFTGKPFSKVIAKGKGISYLAKTFTLPAVTVGSILEYRYKLNYPAGVLPDHEWVAQHDLYTVKEEFQIQSYIGPLRDVAGGVGLSLFPNLPENAKVQRKGDGFELQLENVPAFDEEAYMPPREPYIYHVSMAYGGREMISPEEFWRGANVRWNEEVESFIGGFREVKAAAAEAAAGEHDPEKRLRRLYVRSQQVRNLSYERERTEEEARKENLKPNRNVADVLSRGYGDDIEITRLFVALARAAGFEAAILRSGDRAERIFDRSLLSYEQLDSELALVKLNGHDVYLDPGTRFCPFGSLRWIRTSAKALKLDKKGGTFVDVPMAGYQMAVITRKMDAALDADGALSGDLTVEYQGAEALERRLEALSTDEAGRNNILQNDVMEWLPSGATAQLKDAQGWDGSDVPLEAHFSVAIPGYGLLSGTRIVAPAYLFHTTKQEAFQQGTRRFPVCFPFAFAQDDRVQLRLPAGATLENNPPPQSATIGFAAYSRESRLDGRQLTTRRVLRVNGIFFRPEQYAEVKGFFAQVRTGDEQEIVLQASDRWRSNR